jgi:hypothetical protein
LMPFSLLKSTFLAVGSYLQEYPQLVFVVGTASSVYLLKRALDSIEDDIHLNPTNDQLQEIINKRRSIQLIASAAAGVVVVGGLAVVAYSWSQGHTIATLQSNLNDMKVSNQLLMAKLEDASKIAASRCFELLKSAYSMPFTQSWVFVFNNTMETVTIAAHHTFGKLGGAFDETDSCILAPSEYAILHSNRHSYLVGSGVSLALKLLGLPPKWEDFSHASFVCISDLLNSHQ